MIKKTLHLLSIPLILIAVFAATSFAAGAAVPQDGSLTDLLKPIWDAAHGSHWYLAASLALVAAVATFKKYAPAKAQAWSHTDLGASVLVLAGSFGGALATGLITSGTDAVSASMAWAACQVAIGAAGGYALIKALIVEPLLKSAWYANNAPAWLKVVLSIPMWLFTKPDVAAEAAKAGDAAVAAAPATGADGVVPPKDL